MAEFKSEEQVATAKVEMEAWMEDHPEAAKELQELWGRNLMSVGHKTLGRLLLGRNAG